VQRLQQITQLALILYFRLLHLQAAAELQELLDRAMVALAAAALLRQTQVQEFRDKATMVEAQAEIPRVAAAAAALVVLALLVVLAQAVMVAQVFLITFQVHL
jgi:hypothetical protein